jgi:hypothetical protein
VRRAFFVGAWLALVLLAFFVVHTTVHAHDDGTHVNCALCQLSHNATPVVSGAADLVSPRIIALVVPPEQPSLSVEAADATFVRGPPTLLF